MPDTSLPIVEPQHAYPPRFRGLRRWSIVFVIWLTALIVLRLWWGREAQRRLDAEIAAAHARGEPILPADFMPDPVADSDNAALLLSAAARMIKSSPEQDEWEKTYDDSKPLTPADVRMFGKILRDNAEPLRLAREARSRTQADWGFHPASPVSATLVPWLNDTYCLSDLLARASRYDHIQVDDAQAVERIRDILAVQHALERSPPFLISFTTECRISSAAAEKAIEMAPSLDVAGSGASTTRPASAQQVRRLIDELVDESSLRRDLSYAWAGERMMILDGLPQFMKSIAPRPIAALLEPMLILDAIRVSRQMEQYALAATQPTHAAALAAGGRRIPTSQQSTLHSISTVLSSTVAVGGHPQRILFQSLSDRRAAAIALAIRLYSFDHGGTFPETLEALSPAYLSQVPRDPFAADGRKFNYINDRLDPRIYSVGENGTDERGSRAPRRGNLPTSPWDMLDAVYDLRPLPGVTTMPSSIQPAR